MFLVCSDSTKKTLQKIPGLFPACAIIRAVAKQVDKQSLLLANDQAKSHVVDFSMTMYMITVLQMTTQVMRVSSVLFPLTS